MHESWQLQKNFSDLRSPNPDISEEAGIKKRLSRVGGKPKTSSSATQRLFEMTEFCAKVIGSSTNIGLDRMLCEPFLRLIFL